MLYKTALRRQEGKSKLCGAVAVAHRKNKEIYWYEVTHKLLMGTAQPD